MLVCACVDVILQNRGLDSCWPSPCAQTVTEAGTRPGVQERLRAQNESVQLKVGLRASLPLSMEPV